MSRRRNLFGPLVFLAGWIIHMVTAYFWRTPAPAPQLLFLAVLAVGTLGKTNTAQTLGFLWGLMMDAQGVTLFGCQGWILAMAGYGVGKMSRQIDGDKISAQLLLALIGTLFHLTGWIQVELLFRRDGSVHTPSMGMALAQVLMNAAAVPLVFKAVRSLAEYFPSGEEDHVFRA